MDLLKKFDLNAISIRYTYIASTDDKIKENYFTICVLRILFICLILIIEFTLSLNVTYRSVYDEHNYFKGMNLNWFNSNVNDLDLVVPSRILRGRKAVEKP